MPHHRNFTIHNDRLNPEFIGVGEKYSQYKKHRKNIDRQHESLDCNYQHIHKVNQNMGKTLKKQMQELQRYKNIRQRYNQQMEEKNQQKNQREQFQRKLHDTTMQARQTLRSNLFNAYQTLYRTKKSSTDAINEEKEQLLKKSNRMRITESVRKQKKYQEIKRGEMQGYQKVTQFYREQNMKSLQDYSQRIDTEKHKCQFKRKEIKRIRKAMQKEQKEIEQKEAVLNSIETDIKLYNPLPMMTYSRCKKSAASERPTSDLSAY